MAHVEMSLSEISDNDPMRAAAEQGIGIPSALDVWSYAVTSASEACVLLDEAGVVVAASPGSAALLAIDVADAVGRHLVGEVLRLLDFNPVSGDLSGREIEKIPPLLAISSRGLARGLLRVATAQGGAVTVDAVTTPIRDGRDVVGSLTFFASVGR